MATPITVSSNVATPSSGGGSPTSKGQRGSWKSIMKMKNRSGGTDPSTPTIQGMTTPTHNQTVTPTSTKMQLMSVGENEPSHVVVISSPQMNPTHGHGRGGLKGKLQKMRQRRRGGGGGGSVGGSVSGSIAGSVKEMPPPQPSGTSHNGMSVDMHNADLAGRAVQSVSYTPQVVNTTDYPNMVLPDPNPTLQFMELEEFASPEIQDSSPKPSRKIHKKSRPVAMDGSPSVSERVNFIPTSTSNDRTPIVAPRNRWEDSEPQQKVDVGNDLDAALEWEASEQNSRDGFCRRVDSYDGQVIMVDEKPTYEVGNYLGGGVAGVVYEGTRLRPVDEYPVRLSGASNLDYDVSQHYQKHTYIGSTDPTNPISSSADHSNHIAPEDNVQMQDPFGFCTTCSPTVKDVMEENQIVYANSNNAATLSSSQNYYASEQSHASPRMGSSPSQNGRSGSSTSAVTNPQTPKVGRLAGANGAIAMDVAIEIPKSPTGQSEYGDLVVLDEIDAPSRSAHYTKAASENMSDSGNRYFSEDGIGGRDESRMSHGTAGSMIIEETVAIKILNPVGFRLLAPSAAQGAVIVKQGEAMEPVVANGDRPMQARHVWWLVNPSSRNLRTLQRQPSPLINRGNKGTMGDYVDRGSPERGLRLSLVAAFVDPRTGTLRELPLTKCIEIWGHAPFECTEAEFNAMLDAIERVNAGHPPASPDENLASVGGPSPHHRVTTGETTTSSISNVSSEFHRGSIAGSLRNVGAHNGLYKATFSKRETVYCPSLNAYIAVPAVPPKYLRWLRQRRAATKEIRNMMRIGRHRNVVHLYEVLELIQDSKSTMFLILELVKGGELFDLISSKPAGSGSNRRSEDDNTETMMLKFFRELSSGIAYCHANGIAHRDLKPENLLVHNEPNGECTLKIADFGLSATFNIHIAPNEIDGMSESYSPSRAASLSQMGYQEEQQQQQQQPDEFSSPILKPISVLGATALSYLTCGSIEQVSGCFPNETEQNQIPTPLRRMTSIVGSPHYVAPEIISQSDHDKSRNSKGASGSPGGSVGYDGTKADVWSAGVILYAMLFRSLPFGEDLLRCPRYQSFYKWYEDARKLGGRRSSGIQALSPRFEERDEEEMLGPHWFFPSETSMESRDLIVAMLNPDPFERLSIDMVLRHPWLIKENGVHR